MLKIFSRLVIIISPLANIYQYADYKHQFTQQELRHKSEQETLMHIIHQCEKVMKLLKQ